MDDRYDIKRHRGIAHMIDPSNGSRRTFCGQQTNRPGWYVDEGATLAEFVEQVRPRCAACLKNCKIVIEMQELAEYIQEAR